MYFAEWPFKSLCLLLSMTPISLLLSGLSSIAPATSARQHSHLSSANSFVVYSGRTSALHPNSNVISKPLQNPQKCWSPPPPFRWHSMSISTVTVTAFKFYLLFLPQYVGSSLINTLHAHSEWHRGDIWPFFIEWTYMPLAIMNRPCHCTVWLAANCCYQFVFLFNGFY